VLDFTQAEQTFRFINLPRGGKAPLPSLLRNFSAPVMSTTTTAMPN
jgi:aminopeptidase N